MYEALDGNLIYTKKPSHIKTGASTISSATGELSFFNTNISQANKSVNQQANRINTKPLTQADLAKSAYEAKVKQQAKTKAETILIDEPPNLNYTEDIVRNAYEAKLNKEQEQTVVSEGASERNIDFYAAANGKVLSGKYRDWIGTNMRDSVINSVDDIRLKNAIGEVYRPSSVIGDGGTAHVMRFERETGILLSKSGHVQKGVICQNIFKNY